MRLVFLGSPLEVVPVLDKIQSFHEGGSHVLAGVVSQPPRLQGRGRKLKQPPVAQYAIDHGVPLLQPQKAKEPEFLQQLREWQPDVCLTAAYGQILTNEFLGIPKRGTINLHPSLLPRYRGATPVPSALLDGLERTGITILFTVKALDAGNIILQQESEVQPMENSGQLTTRLFQEGAEMVADALNLMANDGFLGTPQDPRMVTHCSKISKDDGRVDWTLAGRQIWNRFRAYNPWPGSYCFVGGERLTLTEMFLGSPHDAEMASAAGMLAEPGQFTFYRPSRVLLVRTGYGYIGLRRVKPAGGKEMDMMSYWNGSLSKAAKQGRKAFDGS